MATEAGRVKATIEADTAKLVSEAAKTGKQAGKAIGDGIDKGTEQGAKQAKSHLSALASGALKLAGAAALGSFLRAAFDEAQEAKKVGAQVNAVIKSTGGVANVSAGHVLNLATSLSNVAGVDDELVASGENVLLTFKNIRNEAGKGNDVFDQATRAALDMSVALGTDLQSASILVGKALNDPVRGLTALQRVGVTFTAQQREQIKTLVQSGRTLDAQRVILKEFNSEFGGSAAAQATAADKLKVAFGNFAEAVGTALLPLIDIISKVGAAALNLFSALPSWLQSSSLAILAAVLAWAKFGDGAKAAFRVIDSLGVGAIQVIRRVVDAAGGLSTLGVGLGFLGLAAGAAAITVALFGQKESAATVEAKKLEDAVTSTGRSLSDVFAASIPGSLAQADALQKVMAQAGLTTDDLSSAVTKGGPALKAFKERLKEAAASGNIDIGTYRLMQIELDTLSGGYDKAAAKQKKLNEVAKTGRVNAKDRKLDADAASELGAALDTAAAGGGKFADAMSSADTAANTFRAKGLGDLRSALAGGSDEADKFTQATIGIVDAAKQDAVVQLQHGQSLDVVQQSIQENAKAAYDWAIQSGLGEGAARNLALGILEVGRSSDITSAAVDGLNTSMKNALDTMFGVDDAKDKAIEGWAQLADAVKAAGEKHVSLDQALQHTEGATLDEQAAAAKLRDTYRQQIDLIRGQLQAVYKDTLNSTHSQAAAQSALTGSLIGSIGRTREQIIANGGSAKSADIATMQIFGLVSQIGKVPGGKSTNISTPGWDSAVSHAGSVKDAVNGIPDAKTIAIHAAVSGVFASLGSLFGGQKAKGGPVDAGRVYMVGEQGPELFVSDTAGSIVPNNQLGRASTPASVASQRQQTVVNVMLDRRVLVRALAEGQAAYA
jgi:hypothetical protein